MDVDSCHQGVRETGGPEMGLRLVPRGRVLRSLPVLAPLSRLAALEASWVPLWAGTAAAALFKAQAAASPLRPRVGCDHNTVS